MEKEIPLQNTMKLMEMKNRVISDLILTLDDLPDAQTQAKVMSQLYPDEKDVNASRYTYAICKQWHHTFQKYIGAAENKSPGSTRPPGSIVMNIHDMNENIFVDGHIWKQLLRWYPLSDTHELDRRPILPVETKDVPRRKSFKVSFLNTLVGIVMQREKEFVLDELVGYVERQIRAILRVKANIKSRLWIRKDDQSAKFEIVEDRQKRLRELLPDQDDEPYLLALELPDGNKLWPSAFVQDPLGDLGVFDDVTIGNERANQRSDDITIAMETLTKTFVTGINTIANQFVQEMKTFQRSHEEETEKFKEMANSMSKALVDTQSELQEKSLKLLQDETHLKEEVTKLRLQRSNFQNEKYEFLREAELMLKLNQDTKSVITLNIGGQHFVTSRATLTSDPESMLGVMFSGRHKLQSLEDGSYFIDRDSKHFPFILNYLRDGSVMYDNLSEDEERLCELIAEAQFYGIAALVEELTQIQGGKYKTIFDLLYDEEE